MSKDNKTPVHKSNAVSSKTSSQKTTTKKKQTVAPQKQPNKNKSATTPQRQVSANKQPNKNKQVNKNKPMPPPRNAPEAFPHFRRYSKSGHPALIVGEQVDEKQQEEYRYRKVMHNDKDGDRTNEKVMPNPNPKDKDPMYIGKRVRHDEKRFFGKRLPWKYPKK